MMNNEEIKTKIEEAGLARVCDQLLSLVKMSIRFTMTKAADEEILVGASKVGGCPDVPSNYSFPKWKDVPLAFLGQINLSDISKFSASSVLPSSGILSFFYSATQETWGFDPKDKGSWQVYYFADVKALQRIEFPKDLPDEGCYLSCSLSFFEELTLPPWESVVIENLSLTRIEMDSYVNFPHSIASSNKTYVRNRVLGYPDPIQGDMQLECQLVSNGLYCGDETGYKDPRSKELEPYSVNWQLLFQLDSEENAHMCWGDVGRVYFWLPQTALINQDFDKSWMILQCT